MKALRLTAPHQFESVDVDEPGSPGPDDVLIQIHRVGICGTDVSCYLGKMPYFEFPRIPGHELGVEILEAGANVRHVRPGDLCSVEPYLNCQTCYSCRRGYTNCCETNQTLGVMCDGGLTERMILPGRKMHPAPQLTSEQAALVETLGIGCHAVDRGTPSPEETVLIIGAGPIGLSAVEFAKLAAKQTLVMDRVESRLEFVRGTMGVPETILAGDGRERDQLLELTDGRLPDVVIDATGNSHSMAQALDYCAFKGRLVFVGITQTPIEILQAPALHRRELDIRASRNALSRDFTRIIDLIGSGLIDTDPWITHRSSFDELIAHFDTYTRPESGVIKAMVDVSGQ